MNMEHIQKLCIAILAGTSDSKNPDPYYFFAPLNTKLKQSSLLWSFTVQANIGKVRKAGRLPLFNACWLLIYSFFKKIYDKKLDPNDIY